MEIEEIKQMHFKTIRGNFSASEAADMIEKLCRELLKAKTDFDIMKKKLTYPGIRCRVCKKNVVRYSPHDITCPYLE